MGLVVAALTAPTAPVHGYDALPDPVGWLAGAGSGCGSWAAAEPRQDVIRSEP